MIFLVYYVVGGSNYKCYITNICTHVGNNKCNMYNTIILSEKIYNWEILMYMHI